MTNNIKNIRDFREPKNPAPSKVLEVVRDSDYSEILVLGIKGDGQLDVQSSRSDVDWIVGMFDWFISKHR